MSESRIRSLLREPLFHFLALGAVLFVIGWATGDVQGPLGSRIVVTPGEVDRLAASFAATWQRPPTERELEGLVQDHIREEVYFREALNLGLDRNDIIIRRRLRQKMEFLTQDLADAVQPTDEELQAFLEANVDDYRIPDRYTVSQVLFRTDRDAERARAAAESALQALGDPTSPRPMPQGDRSMLPPTVEDVASREVARVYGEQFLSGLGALPVGRWSGPVESGYGLHLVYVHERREGRAPTLEEVYPLVMRDWTTQQRGEVNDAVYAEMLSRYTVVLERPDGTEERWTLPERASESEPVTADGRSSGTIPGGDG